MTESSVDDVVRLMSSDDTAERVALIEMYPPTGTTESALLAARMTMPEMRPQALDLLAMSYNRTGRHDLAARLGEATYRLARSMYERRQGDLETLQMIAGRGALSWCDGLKHLGKNREVLRLIEEPIEWLEQLGDTANLDLLRLKRVETELDLELYDAADAHLAAISESELPPMVRVVFRAHKLALEQRKGGGTELREEHPEYSLGDVTRLFFSGEKRERRGPPLTAAQGQTLLDVTNALTRFLGGAQGAVNAFTVRQRILDASYLFADPRKGRDPAEIEKVIPTLRFGRDWMLENGYPDFANDARWGLYLAYDRTGRQSLAARELQALRASIEHARSNLADPMDRSRLSARYPYLYPSLASLCFQIGDVRGLFETIEASKGRVLADLQTHLRGVPAHEADFSAMVWALPSFIAKLRCAYVTYLVDDDVTFAVVLDRHGNLRMHRIPLGVDALSALARARDPRTWGKRDPDTLTKAPDVPRALTPLVECLNDVADDPEVQHVCYSPSGPLLGIPLHCAHLGARPLAARFSVSRVHGAASLFHLFAREPVRPGAFLTVEVPAKQDLGNPKKLAALAGPGNWLAENLSSGARIHGPEADAETLARLQLDNRILVFAAHGTFPAALESKEAVNPYSSSGLLLAQDGRLPDLDTELRGSSNLLSPEKLVDLELDLSNSHVILGGCVTGLASPSAGGDALGLEFAMIQSGAASLLASHWDLAARDMAAIVVDFLDRWLNQRKTRAEAWHEAISKLGASSDWASSTAYHWAALSLTGDWR
ncbi:MAG: CHAT domain-containing protein [Pseudomonadota bacterium]